MLQRALTIIVIILAVTLQISLGHWMTWGTPELVLIALLVVGLFSDTVEAIWWAALGGLLLDMIIGSPAGFYLITFSIIGILLVGLTRNVFQQPAPFIAAGIFLIIALIYEVALAFLTDTMMVHLLVRAGITTVLASTIYTLLFYFGKRQEVIQLG